MTNLSAFCLLKTTTTAAEGRGKRFTKTQKNENVEDGESGLDWRGKEERKKHFWCFGKLIANCSRLSRKRGDRRERAHFFLLIYFATIEKKHLRYKISIVFANDILEDGVNENIFETFVINIEVIFAVAFDYSFLSKRLKSLPQQ